MASNHLQPRHTHHQLVVVRTARTRAHRTVKPYTPHQPAAARRRVAQTAKVHALAHARESKATPWATQAGWAHSLHARSRAKTHTHTHTTDPHERTPPVFRRHIRLPQSNRTSIRSNADTLCTRSTRSIKAYPITTSTLTVRVGPCLVAAQSLVDGAWGRCAPSRHSRSCLAAIVDHSRSSRAS